MRVLVTGGAGYIGSHTLKALAQGGHEPVALDDLSNGHGDAVQGGTLIVGNMGDAALVRKTIRDYEIGAVLHLGASAYVGESVRDPRKYFENNVTNTMSLLGAMLEENVKTIVFSSSCASYGIPASLPIAEDTAQQPVNPYGWSKLMVEQVLKAYGRAYGLKWLALRYFNAAGADPEGELGERHDPETHLIPLLIEAAFEKRGEVELFGMDYATPDGSAIRDYVHVSDLADAHVLALAHLLRGGDPAVFNLGTGVGCSVKETVAAVAVASGRRVPVRNGPRREGDPAELVADASRAKAVLGWSPRRSDMETIVETALRWHAAQAVSLPASRGLKRL